MDRRAQIKQWLRDVLESNLSGISYRAFIFGSQANELSLKRADIDVGIIAESHIPIEKLASLNSAIEQLPMLYSVDIVNFEDVEESFKLIALTNTEAL